MIRRGHAVEVRLYAEDPGNGFLPVTGRVLEWSAPRGAHLRLDAGVAAGSEVGIHYDPLLAKLIAWGSDREQSRRRMVQALTDLGLLGLATNREFLLAVLRHPRYRAGEITTHFIAEALPDWKPSADPHALRRRAIVATVFHAARRNGARAALPTLLAGWRSHRWRRAEQVWQVGDEALRVDYLATADGWRAAIGEEDHRVTVLNDADALTVEIDGWCARYAIRVDGDATWVRDADGATCLVAAPRFPSVDDEDEAGVCEAPMPGKVVQVLVEAGQAVAKGASLVILEAMKMEQTLAAPAAGVVLAVHVAAGDQVDAGATLVELEAGE